MSIVGTTHVVPSLIQLISWGFVAVVTFDFIRYLRSGKLARHLSVFRRRPASLWLVAVAGSIVLLACVVTAGLSLIALWPSGFGLSWLDLLKFGKPGTPSGTNLIAAGTQIPWFGFAFAALLGLNVPRLARREEEVFRRGTTSWADGAYRSLKFGLVHCIVGVPLGFGLALSLGGLWFTYQYFRGGVRRAAFFHTIYNCMILVLLIAYLVWAAI